MLKFRTAAAMAALTLAACPLTAHAQNLEDGELWGMEMIGVQAAYDRGYTGDGVVVGVLDSGANMVHRDLIANLSPWSLDVFSGGPVTGDPNGHGSHVAGTIAGVRDGAGVYGVAYDAELVILRILDADNAASGPANDEAMVVNFALDHGVRIFNNSWGGGFIVPEAAPAEVAEHIGPENMAAYQRAVNLDSILVWATGNETFDQPGIQAGLPYYFPSWQGHWLAVTAVGTDGILASYANKCGLAAPWCLAAPGGDVPLPGQTTDDSFIISVGNTAPDELAAKGGTSMAAPHVSGAVAIARQMFPQAPAAGVTRLILATATDLGAPGIDEEYGWGLLNVGNMAATRDAQAGSVFANGAWAADAGQRALFEALDERTAAQTRPGAWATVLAGRAGHDATRSSLASDAETFGAAAGYDIAARGGVLLGVSLAQTRTTADEAAGANRAEVESLTVSLYARADRDRLFFEGATGLSIHDYAFRRGDILGMKGTVMAAAGVAGQAEADGVGAFARGRIGLRFEAGSVQVRPFVQARVAFQRLDAFTEQGADVFSQTADSASQTLYEAGPGVEVAMAPRPLGKAEVGGALSLRYDTRWGDDFAVPTRLLGAPVSGAVGELDDGLTVSGRLNARIGGWDIGARSWWSGGGNNDGAGAGLSARLAF